MNPRDVSFQEYKSQWTLTHEHEDFFLDVEQYGCHETTFERWLKRQRMFIKRYGENCTIKLCDLELPERTWQFFTRHFERVTRTQYLVDKYPDGFFEAITEDGQVAAFLPDTYGKKPYRLSFYGENGARYHETYDSRSEALTVLAHRKYSAKEGVLDALVGTDSWNRGVYICNWIAEGILPHDGLKRDKHIPEVAQLFAERLQAA